MLLQLAIEQSGDFSMLMVLLFFFFLEIYLSGSVFQRWSNGV